MINVEQRDRVVHLVINAPPVNVLDGAILGELVERLGELAKDDSVAAVVLSGEYAVLFGEADVLYEAANAE